jgi:hypothetical protein
MTSIRRSLYLSFAAIALAASARASFADPSIYSPSDDLALNSDPSLSDDGWGGGTDKWDLTDGSRTYPGDWARGLALPWDGETHQITLVFTQPITFDEVIQWDHGAGPDGYGAETPAAYTIQYWNLNTDVWTTIFSTSDPEAYLEYPDATSNDWWYYWSTPYLNTFTPVTSNMIRIWETPVPGRYNWLYEVEVYNNTSATPGPAAGTVPAATAAIVGARRLRRRRSR